jgi:hypothetical protein
MLLRTFDAHAVIAIEAMVDATKMGFLKTDGPSAIARKMCAATTTPKSAPEVVTYAFMVRLQTRI